MEVGRRVRIVGDSFRISIIGSTGIVCRVIRREVEEEKNGTDEIAMLVVHLDEKYRFESFGRRVEKVWTYVSDIEFID